MLLEVADLLLRLPAGLVLVGDQLLDLLDLRRLLLREVAGEAEVAEERGGVVRAQHRGGGVGAAGHVLGGGELGDQVAGRGQVGLEVLGPGHRLLGVVLGVLELGQVAAVGLVELLDLAVQLREAPAVARVGPGHGPARAQRQDGRGGHEGRGGAPKGGGGGLHVLSSPRWPTGLADGFGPESALSPACGEFTPAGTVRAPRLVGPRFPGGAPRDSAGPASLPRVSGRVTDRMPMNGNEPSVSPPRLNPVAWRRFGVQEARPPAAGEPGQTT